MERGMGSSEEALGQEIHVLDTWPGDVIRKTEGEAALARVEPVFIAHPTEARRRTLLQKLANHRPRLEAREANPLERVQSEVMGEITSLWRTEESSGRSPHFPASRLNAAPAGPHYQRQGRGIAEHGLTLDPRQRTDVGPLATQASTRELAAGTANQN